MIPSFYSTHIDNVHIYSIRKSNVAPHLNGGTFNTQIVAENFGRMISSIDEQFMVGATGSA